MSSAERGDFMRLDIKVWEGLDKSTDGGRKFGFVAKFGFVCEECGERSDYYAENQIINKNLCPHCAVDVIVNHMNDNGYILKR